MIKKIDTKYELQLGVKYPSVYVTVSAEQKNHISVHALGDPCNGILHHWGKKEALIEELQAIIIKLKEVDFNTL